MSYENRLTSDHYIGHGKHLNVSKHKAITFPLHAHEFFEVEIVIEGEGTHMLNGVDYPIQRGSAYVISPSDFHAVDIKDNGSMTVWHITMDETLLPPHILQEVYCGSICRVLDETELRKVTLACELLYEEFSSGGAAAPLCDYILSVIINTPRFQGDLTPMRRAILYVETHFRENPSLADAAEQACLSPVYFGNLFKQITGETYINFLNARKVSCAKMLLESGCSVTEACFASGFGSLSGFLHAFKQKTGVSPEKYKKGGRK